MVRSRPSPRLVALLVYALVVNALLWAAGANARPTLPGSVYCHTTTSSAVVPTFPAKAAVHECCDLACGAMFALPPPGVAQLSLADVSDGTVAHWVELRTRLDYRVRPWPTGPPSH